MEEHPHTKTIAATIADRVQDLNHATQHPTHPVDVYDIIGQLYVAVGRLPQTVDQLSGHLTRSLREGAATTGNPDHDQTTATAYADHMTDTTQHLEMALRSLGRAHQAMADVRTTNPDTNPATA